MTIPIGSQSQKHLPYQAKKVLPFIVARVVHVTVRPLFFRWYIRGLPSEAGT